MAGNSREKDADDKECAEQHGGLRSEMKERAAGWHDNSPHTMIRRDGPVDFRTWDRKCVTKTGGEYRGDARKMENGKCKIGPRRDFRDEIRGGVRICV